jgi:predicted TIM-barrel fold metal-dependent hydrolase
MAEAATTGNGGDNVAGRRSPPLPEGSWDCHIHVFPDPSHFEFAADRRYTPTPVSPDDARAVLHRIGARHAVIQHATPYGADNDSLLWSVAAMKGQAVGVAACLPEQTLRVLDPSAWSAAGIAGFRIHVSGSAAALQARHMLETAGSALAGSRMHLDLHPREDAVAALATVIGRLPVPVVLDHFAGLPPTGGGVPPVLAELMERGNVWLKLSASYRVPGLEDEALGDAVAVLMEAYPERCLWGSDWPHTPPHPPGEAARLRPQPYRLIDTVGIARRMADALTETQRHRLFIGNPSDFYGWALVGRE